MNKTTVKARISPELKDQATAVLNSIGLSMSGAIEMTLRQIVAHGGLPFEVKLPANEIPNATTQRAIREAGERKGRKAQHIREILGD